MKTTSAELAVEQVIQARPSLVGIDGLPCSGKSTLARTLCEKLGAQCLALDDFVLPEKDWPRNCRPGFPFPYIRYDAFLSAIISLGTHGACSYDPFDWGTGEVAVGARRSLQTPVVVEGVSALNPSVAHLYDVRIFVESDEQSVLEAALERGVGHWEGHWRNLFMPSVLQYMHTSPASRAHVLVAGRGVSPLRSRSSSAA